MNAMVIDPRDNVAVAIEPIEVGDTVEYLAQGTKRTITAKEAITIYHKIALCDIEQGAFSSCRRGCPGRKSVTGK